jgi:uncharacterized damage-inducible protein DinB
MMQLTPDQALLVLQYQLGGLKRESRTTASVLRAVPADRADYRPDPHAKTAMELVRHIAIAENRFLETVTLGRFDPAVEIPAGVATPSDVAGWYEERFARNFEGLTRATPDQLLKPVDFRGMFTWPALNFITLGLHHTIHHRGQLSSYLRPMGAAVPAIYGDSYDTARARSPA